MVDFSKGQDINILMENLALCHENLLNQYIEIGNINRNSIVEAIFERKVFPCYFGSALKIDGVEELLDGLNNIQNLTSTQLILLQKFIKYLGMSRETVLPI